MTYTVYALYYEGADRETACAKGFVGSTSQPLKRCLNDHTKWIASDRHTNKNLQATASQRLEMYVVDAGLDLKQCNTLLKSLRPSSKLGWNITSASRDTTDRHTGSKRPKETKEKLSKAMSANRVGHTHSDETKEAIRRGKLAYFRPATVYDYATKQPVAVGVSLSEWCRENGHTKRLGLIVDSFNKV